MTRRRYRETDVNAPPTTHRISEFHRWNTEKRLQLSPPYQRKPVWSPRTKSYLIDTILSKLPVPEIYMQVKTDKTGNTIYDVVDGQQRIRAILEFISGEYAINEEDSPDFGGKEFSDLSEGVTKAFWNYQLVTRELNTNKEAEIREIFRRLNKNVVPLNHQELRHATYAGDFIKLVEELAELEYWAENKIVSPSQIKRMEDAEYVSELLVGIVDGPQDGTKTLDKHYEMYDADFKDKDEWRRHFHRTLDLVEEAFGELRGTNWNQKADFYALFIAISNLQKNHIFPQENYADIKKSLFDFRRLVNIEKEQSTDTTRNEYYDTIGFGGIGRKELREKRIALTSNLLLECLVSKDPQHRFTKEQRQLAWDLSKDKRCAWCNKKIEFKDYELDHKIEHSKGGKTELKNSQILHKECHDEKHRKNHKRADA